MDNQKKPIENFSDINVKLKPLFGIKPGVYLFGLYLFIIVTAVFCILFLPGIVNYGTKVNFTTIPEKTIIQVDDTYVGPSPCETFVRSGNRKMTFSKPYYKTQTSEIKIGGSVFASFFFPKKQAFFIHMEIEDLNGLLAWSLDDFAPFGIINDFTFDYQLPPVLSDAACAYYSKNASSLINDDTMYDFLKKAMLYVDSEHELYDFLKALGITAARGSVLSIKSLVSITNKIIQLKKECPDLPVWMANALPRSKVKYGNKKIDKFSMYDKLSRTKWFIDYLNKAHEKISKLENYRMSGNPSRSISVDGLQFMTIPGGSVVMGNAAGIERPDDLVQEMMPNSVVVASFQISVSEISHADFHRFVKANPAWNPSNRKVLMEKGLATESYLRSWTANGPLANALDEPVSAISWYAAEAYCAWFSQKLSGRLKARLPRESEWEYIAKADESIGHLPYPAEKKSGPEPVTAASYGKSGLKNMYGNLWTWCADWFLPARSTLSPFAETYLYGKDSKGAEKAVRGGSWLNSKQDNLRSWTRGSLPPSDCSDFTGFRIVLSDR